MHTLQNNIKSSVVVNITHYAYSIIYKNNNINIDFPTVTIILCLQLKTSMCFDTVDTP